MSGARRATVAAVFVTAAVSACAHRPKMPSMPSMPSMRRAPGDTAWPAGMLDTTRRLAVVDTFSGPEAVHYDRDQDVYFVANFGPGEAAAKDNNGFISRMRPDGRIEELRFIAGGANGVTLHAPRGMTIVGDTLWVADNDAVRGFDRHNGTPTATIDFTSLAPGFLNDIAHAPDGTRYVTDTPRNRIYRIGSRGASIAVEDSTLGSPNGIAWDDWNVRFIVVPYDGRHVLLSWSEGNPPTPFASSSGGKFDGVEILGPNQLLVSSQADSSLHLFVSGTGRPVIKTSGRPADIGLDTKRMRVAVPFIALNRVEIWQLPREPQATGGGQ
jgi:DNA-binding beta-propeller fold protein YncE